MKPKEKEYEEPVVVPKIWEEINGEHHLVTKKVSNYIRELETDLQTARRLLAEKLEKDKS